MQFIPTGNRLVVVPDMKDDRSILMPGSNLPREYEVGLVLGVGEGRVFENGKVIPMPYVPGDRVAYLPEGQIELVGLGQKCILVGGHQVLGKYADKVSESLPVAVFPYIVKGQ